MIKKRLFKHASVLLSAVLVAGCITACGSTNSATKNSDTSYTASASVTAASGLTEETLTEALNSEANVSTLKTNTRKETVYVFGDANGKTSHTTVSTKVTDASGNTTTTNTESSEAAPVSINVTYKLDGKEISAADLAGKSGKVTIRFDYTNNKKTSVTVNGKSQEAYIPFTVLSGLVMDNSKFSNIEVTNGKVMEAAGNYVVVGTAMPGLKDSLNLKFSGETLDLDIPEYVEVTADVKDFSLDMTMSVATTSFLSDIDLDDLSIDSLKSQVNALKDGANQLVSGSNELQAGTQKLADSVPDLTSGINALNDGAKTLAEGTTDLASGANSLSSGITAYTAGVTGAKTGAESLSSGSTSISSGLDGVVSVMKSQVVPGVADAATGAENLSAGMTKLSAAITSSFETIKTNAATYGENAETIASATQLAALGRVINSVLGDSFTMYHVTPVDDLNNLDVTDSTAVQTLMAKYMAGYAWAVENSKSGSTNYAQITYINNTLSNYGYTADKIYQSEMALLLQTVSNKSIAGALNQVYTTAMTTKDATTGMTLSESLTALTTGASQLSTGLKSLKAGIGDFDDLTGTTTICSVLYQLKVGSAQVADGASQLSSGLSTLESNNSALTSGASDLSAGAEKLNSGASELSAGTSTLNDASSTLASGVSELNAGAIKLRDGMVEFNDTGISKITSLVGDDADIAIATIKEVVKLGKNYTSFTGTSDGKESSVVFIYKTAQIGE